MALSVIEVLNRHSSIAEVSAMMATIRSVWGDVTEPQSKGNWVIAHTCNDLGGWSASVRPDRPEAMV